jgi:hypothetical protein
MQYPDTENRRADEQTKTREGKTPPSGGADVGGRENKRAQFAVKERGVQAITTGEVDRNPAPVAEYDELGKGS